MDVESAVPGVWHDALAPKQMIYLTSELDLR
jgi:hypothetical protein